MAINNTQTYTPPANAPRLSVTYGPQGQVQNQTFANPQAVAAGEPTSQAYGSPMTPTGASTTFTPAANTVGLNSNVSSTQPVVTSSAAEEDANNKYSVFKNLQEQVAGQSNAVQQAKLQAAASQAESEYQAAQLKLQQQEADTNTQTAAAKTAAVTAATAGGTGPTTSPQAPTGPSTPQQPSIPSPYTQNDTINQGLTQTTGQYTSGLNDIQSQKDSLVASMQTQLNSLMSGTFPLTPTQTALINSLQSQLQTNVAVQQQANTANTGAATEAAFRAGGEYTPGQTAGTIANTISQGVLRIQQLDNSAATTMAQLEQGFQQQNFDLVNKSYDILNQQLSDKATTLTDTYNAVTKSLQDQRDYNMKVASAQLEQEKFAEQKKTDAATIQHEQNADAVANAQLKLSQATFNAAYGGFMNSDGTPNTSVSPQSIPGYTQLSNGMSVIDNSSGLFKAPTIGGIPVPSAANYKVASDAATQASTLSQMQALYNEYFTQPGNNANARNQYAALKATLPTDIQSSTPDIGILTGSVLGSHPILGASIGNNQFTSAFTKVNGIISSVIPGVTPPPFGATFKSPQEAQSYFQSSNQYSIYKGVVDKANAWAESKFGKGTIATDGQVLAFLNGK